jgi:triphosphoribosyl-dephospho-CoA synthase
MSEFPSQLSKWIQSACLLEAAARKPGNVHPSTSFADLTYDDLVKSAEVIAPIVAQAGEVGVGETIFRAVSATREQVGTNSNLGILLLITPLAAVPLNLALSEGISPVLAALDREEARWVYRSIRLAQAGGMGEVPEGDVAAEPAGTLIEMMQLAARRDRIAAEYASGFSLTLNFGAPFLAGVADFRTNWEAAIIELSLRLMAEYPDTLIARKCGPAIAEESAGKAREVLESAPVPISPNHPAVQEFDRWLRADGHRRNPGTTADLVAASLFAAFREGMISPP